MKCHCGREMEVVSEYHNPDVAAGHRDLACPDHPKHIERTAWYCPYIPLERPDKPIGTLDQLLKVYVDPTVGFKTRYAVEKPPLPQPPPMRNLRENEVPSWQKEADLDIFASLGMIISMGGIITAIVINSVILAIIATGLWCLAFSFKK